jgi:hypothetical protein
MDRMAQTILETRRCLMKNKNEKIGELNKKAQPSFLKEEIMFLQRS